MDGNKKRSANNSGSKKPKPSKRNKIGAHDDDARLINNGYDMEMDSIEEEKKNNHKKAASRLKNAIGNKIKSKNPILFISNVMQNAQRWKNYATSRRKIASAGMSNDNDRRRTGGNGLTPECEGEIKRKDIVDGSDKNKSEREMRNIHNRNLIEYFARLGQSKKEDETVNLEYVLSLLNNGADINCTDKYKQTVLHEAARAWDVDVARFIGECGAKLDQGDYRGRTALHVAAAVDYPDMVNYLIEAGANKEARTDEELQTPVHFAARNDARESLKALLKNGCEYKEVRDYKGRTPIHVAAELDRSETARMLLELDEPAPAGVKDNSGQAAIVWMITKMPPVAKIALDQFHTTDRANRKQFYHLNWLEPKAADEPEKPKVHPQTAVQVVVAYRRYDIIRHPVIQRLIRLKWKQFARWRAVFQTLMNLVFILLWSSQGVIIDYQEKHRYELPGQWWRIFLLVVALLMAAWQIKEELYEYFLSKRSHAHWKEWREEEIQRDLKFVHNRWPEEEQYLKQEIEELDNIRPQYFNDFWNIFDWICYALLLVCIITHLVDVFQHTNFIARLHVRLMASTIIIIWLRLLKNVRAFSLLGPFIVIVGHMIRDVFKFFFLYLAFFLPYACAFWMLFGADKIPEKYQGQPWAMNYTVRVPGMDTPNALMFSLFRLTLVDEYAYDDMKAVDDIMTDFLVGTWLALSAIVMINLFIALMSDTFQRVFDNANANAVMQKAITILSIEEGLTAKKRNQFRSFIHEKCAPEKDYYDDDATDTAGTDLQKVTIQIKEQLDDLCESLYQEKKRKEQATFDHLDGETDDSDDDDDGGSGGGGSGGGIVTKKVFDEEMEKIQEDMCDIIDTQNAMAEKLQKDMKKVMGLLEQIALSSMTGGIRPVDAVRSSPISLPPSGRNYDQNLLVRRSSIMEMGDPLMGTFGSTGNTAPPQVPAILPASNNGTGEWGMNNQIQPPAPESAWDDLDIKRKRDLKELRDKLAKQQKIAARHGKKVGRRRKSHSVTSDEEDRHRYDDNESVLTDSSVIPEIEGNQISDSVNPKV